MNRGSASAKRNTMPKGQLSAASCLTRSRSPGPLNPSCTGTGRSGGSHLCDLSDPRTLALSSAAVWGETRVASANLRASLSTCASSPFTAMGWHSGRPMKWDECRCAARDRHPCLDERAGRDYVTSLGRKPPRVVPSASCLASLSRHPDSRIKRRRPSQPDSTQRRARRKANSSRRGWRSRAPH